MGNITHYTGGQNVTDSMGTGDRRIEQVDALPGTPVPGVIYLTPSIISNAVTITGFEFTDDTDIAFGGGTRVVRVTGEEGAEYSLSYSSGASGATGNQVIPASGTQDTTVTIAANGGGGRSPGVTLTPNVLSDPETVSELVDATISINQAAAPSYGNSIIVLLAGVGSTAANPLLGDGNATATFSILIAAGWEITNIEFDPSSFFGVPPLQPFGMGPGPGGGHGTTNTPGNNTNSQNIGIAYRGRGTEISGSVSQANMTHSNFTITARETATGAISTGNTNNGISQVWIEIP